MNRRSFLKALSIPLFSILTGGSIFSAIGTYLSKSTIVANPQQLNSNLVGYKGSEFFKSGYIYAPYLPLVICDCNYLI